MHYWTTLSGFSTLTAFTAATPVPQTALTTEAQCYTGSSFPDILTWMPFAQLINTWSSHLTTDAGDSAEEVTSIMDSIDKYSQRFGVDNRLIFAILVRESSGNAATKCGDDGLSCGLMQVKGHNVPTCTQHPCAQEQIDQMILCGTGGCATPGSGAGSNLKDCMNRYPSGPGAVARCYNTGSVPDASDLTKAGTGNPAYVQDIANILTVPNVFAWSVLDLGKTCPVGAP